MREVWLDIFKINFFFDMNGFSWWEFSRQSNSIKFSHHPSENQEQNKNKWKDSEFFNFIKKKYFKNNKFLLFNFFERRFYENKMDQTMHLWHSFIRRGYYFIGKYSETS